MKKIFAIVSLLMVLGAGRSMQAMAAAEEGVSLNQYLFAAAFNGNKALVQKLVEEDGADVNAWDARGGTPLMIAARNGHKDVVTYLLAHGVVLEEQSQGMKAVVDAALFRHCEIADFLLDSGVEKNKTLNLVASRSGAGKREWALKVVRFLLDRGVDVRARDIHEQTPLMCAAMGGSVDVIKELIDFDRRKHVLRALNTSESVCPSRVESEAFPPEHIGWTLTPLFESDYVNLCSDDQSTALIMAARYGRIDAIKFLIGHGADMDAANKFGFTALVTAVDKGYQSIVELLINSGADLAVHGQGGCALAIALHKNFPKIVDLLVKQRADKDAALRMASFSGYERAVETLIAQGADVNAKNGSGHTCLMLASARGYQNIVAFLMDHGVVLAASKQGAHALVDAANNNHPAIAEFLIARGADINEALLHACYCGAVPAIEFLVAHGADKNAGLREAASQGQVSAVEKLIQLGVDVNAENREGNTPLVFAAYHGHQAMVEFLMGHGVELAHANQGAYAVVDALKNNHSGIAEFLLAQGADINEAFAWAGHCGHIHAMEFLLARGANINAVSKRKMGLLEEAAYQGRREVIEFLFNHGLVLNDRIRPGVPLVYAAEEGHADSADLLIAHGVKEGEALFCACRNGLLKTVTFLINRGVDINTRDSKNQTALHRAARAGHRDLIEFLIAHGADVSISDNEGKTAADVAVNDEIRGMLQAVAPKQA